MPHEMTHLLIHSRKQALVRLKAELAVRPHGIGNILRGEALQHALAVGDRCLQEVCGRAVLQCGKGPQAVLDSLQYVRDR